MLETSGRARWKSNNGPVIDSEARGNRDKMKKEKRKKRKEKHETKRQRKRKIKKKMYLDEN